jgi:hypothetical protein
VAPTVPAGAARLAAAFSLVGLVTCVAAVATLHVLRPDLDPVSERISQYATGPHGWLMAAAFVALAVGLAGLGVALAARVEPAVPGPVLVAAGLVGASGAALSAAYRAGAPRGGDQVHSWASLLLVLGVLVIAGGTSFASSRRGARRRAADRLGARLVTTGAVLVVPSTALQHTVVGGATQRLLWLVLVAWLLRAAWATTRAAGAEGHAPAVGDEPGARATRTSTIARRRKPSAS